MPRSPRTLILATLAAGAAACGAALAFLALAGPFDPRAAAGGVLAAAALAASLLGLAWARRCTRPRPGGAVPRRPAPGPARGLTVIPLGGNEAAVIFDEPAPRAPVGDTAGVAEPARTNLREAAEAADAIWAAVDASILGVAEASAADAPSPPGTPRSLLDRMRRRPRRGPGGGPDGGFQ